MIRLFLIILCCLACVGKAQAKADVEQLEGRIQQLEKRLQNLEAEGKFFTISAGPAKIEANGRDAASFTLFCFGVVCALWAQNTGRGSWRWFFFGLLLGPLAAIVMLVKNSNDKSRQSIANHARLES